MRVASLCLSGAFRALCGVVAGGSKTALTVHFASSGRIPGDIGDLNAKDASKETVLALLGMLVSFYRSRVRSPAYSFMAHVFLLRAGLLWCIMCTIRRRRMPCYSRFSSCTSGQMSRLCGSLFCALSTDRGPTLFGQRTGPKRLVRVRYVPTATHPSHPCCCAQVT